MSGATPDAKAVFFEALDQESPEALQRFLDHVQQHDDVWICKRVDIARHWYAKHPFKP